MSYSQAASDPHGFAQQLNTLSSVRKSYRKSPSFLPPFKSLDTFIEGASEKLSKLPSGEAVLPVPKKLALEMVDSSTSTISSALRTADRLHDLETSLSVGTAITNFLELLLDQITSRPLPPTAAAYTATVNSLMERLSAEKRQVRIGMGIAIGDFRLVYDDGQIEYITSRAEMNGHKLLFQALDTLNVTPADFGVLMDLKAGRNVQAHPLLKLEKLLGLPGEIATTYGDSSAELRAMKRVVEATRGVYSKD